MPDSSIHEQLTREAVAFSGVRFDPMIEKSLVTQYCQLPDLYFGEAEKWTKYQYFTDGIQFHYLPDTPWNDLYRYWGYDSDGKLQRVRPFRNDNYIHARNGFLYLLNQIVSLWRNHETDEGCKYLGTLLHTLEDATFGCHSMEGPHGVDFFALNRLSGQRPVQFICRIRPDHEPLENMPEHPAILGNTVEETVMSLYAQYVRTAVAARQCCFREALRYFNGAVEPSWEAGHFMRRNSVILLSSVIAAAWALTNDGPHLSADRMLSEFEPVEFPFSGAGEFHFQMARIQDHTISFGLQQETNLIYEIAPVVFQRFTADLELDESGDTTEIQLEIINHENSVQHLTLYKDKIYPICVERPQGKFGFRFRTIREPGSVILRNAKLTRV